MGSKLFEVPLIHLYFLMKNMYVCIEILDRMKRPAGICRKRKKDCSPFWASRAHNEKKTVKKSHLQSIVKM